MRKQFFLALALGFVLFGCGQKSNSNTLVAVVYPTDGNVCRGVVKFTKEGNGLHVVAEITGLATGKHGFHIHEFGDCSDFRGASSAGRHFNPDQVAHGAPEDHLHHAGDLGNLIADSTGQATLDKVFDSISLDGKKGILGRAVIIHELPDDLSSQPAGAAGVRIGCGAIGIAK